MAFPTNTPLPPPRYRGATTRSLYIPMRDGVRLAVDLALPRAAMPTDRFPALFAATRYWRAQRLRAPFAWFLRLPDSARDFFTAYGYALLRIDMRGTGASEGHQPHPWPDSDLTDLYDLVDWAIRQPWSNGQVYGFGNSYQATTAELLGACAHPAVVGALVRFNEYDLYTDIAFPGGVPNAFILREWAAFNRALDADQLPHHMPLLDKLFVRGVKPVGNAPIPQHHNRQVDSALTNITFRDDYDPVLGTTIDAISIHTRPTTHVLDHWGSWFDAATADAVIRRFLNNPRPQRAVIGAWNHGATQQVGMAQHPFPLREQMQEALRMFAQPPGSRELHYFTIFANTWHTTTEWPPPGLTPTRFFFQPGNELAAAHPTTSACNRFSVDFAATTGRNNRWQTELDQRPVRYVARPELLAYTTAPFERETTITGSPVVTLFVRSTHSDGAFFVYLEALDPQGRTHYLSEGMLRAIHRKHAPAPPPYRQIVPYHSFKRADALPLVPGEVAELTFGLQPISALIRRGWRLRVALAGADCDTFARIPAQGKPTVEILLGGAHASCIEVPMQ